MEFWQMKTCSLGPVQSFLVCRGGVYNVRILLTGSRSFHFKGIREEEVEIAVRPAEGIFLNITCLSGEHYSSFSTSPASWFKLNMPQLDSTPGLV
jgi:hypothetical protein